MPAASKKSYGPTVQARAKHLLQVILGVVADADQASGIKFNADWADATPPRLTIETTLKDLTRLVHPNLNANTPEFKKAKALMGEALGDLRDFVQILDDHRTQKKGSDRWHFSLRLWGKDADWNLAEFDKLWESKRSPNSQPKPLPEVSKEPISAQKSESSVPKPSSVRNSQTTLGDAQGVQVNDSQGTVIAGSNPVVNIILRRPRNESSKKIVLMLPASSVSIASPRWQEEVTKIRKAIERAKNIAEEKHENNFEKYEFQDRPYINSSDLSQDLTALMPHIIHISGCEEGIAELVIGDTSQRDNNNQNNLISELFSLHENFINCIVLSGCCLESQIREISQHIEFIIGVPESLEETISAKFFDEFYFHLASNIEIEVSYNLGKNLLRREGYIDEDLFPKLFYQKDEINRRGWEAELAICIKDLEEQPENITLLKKKASLFKDLGRIHELNETHENISNLEPTKYENRVKQGDDLEELGDHGKADIAYTKALELEETDYKVWWKKAIAYANAGEHMQAGESYKNALALLPPSPDDYVICIQYAIILKRLKKFHESIQAYSTSICIQPKYRVASYHRKQMYKKIYSKN
jgi:tetratricopeptide (TPR) repeat protein